MSDHLQKLEELKKLRDEGVLIPEEFEREKQNILNDVAPTPKPVLPEEVAFQNPASKSDDVKTNYGAIFLIVGGVSLIAFLVSTFSKNEDPETTNSNASNSYAAVSPEPINSPSTIKERLRDQSAVLSTFGGSNYKGSIDGIIRGLTTLAKINDVISEGEITMDDSIQSMAKAMRKKLAKTQSAELPRMRKEYGIVASNLLWESNGKARVSGTSITFVATEFASNANIKEFHETVNPILNALRFKRVNYKWIESDYAEYTYFTLFNADLGTKDADPIPLDEIPK